MRTILKLFLLVIVVAAAWVGWALWLPKAPPQPRTVVLLRPGWSTKRIANELQSAGVIRNANTFLMMHVLARPRSLKAGEYEFTTAANAITIRDRLVRGDILKHTVVVPEGFNVYDVAAAVEEAGLGSRNDFVQAARGDIALIADLDPQARSLEGYLFPDTYQFTRTQTVGDIVAIMVRRFRQEARAAGLTDNPPGYVHRIVTMASIVEKETAVAEERPMVASVYYNRLAKNMALAADPSVIYAKLLDGSYDGSLHHEDMQIDSPYNTYRYAGLPPGPIANPGRSALNAALHPASSDYFYFVADGSGGHRFARTLDEHSRNVAAYRRALAANR